MAAFVRPIIDASIEIVWDKEYGLSIEFPDKLSEEIKNIHIVAGLTFDPSDVTKKNSKNIHTSIMPVPRGDFENLKNIVKKHFEEKGVNVKVEFDIISPLENPIEKHAKLILPGISIWDE